ncbi:MAG TPA: GNAT family N-acetyltransferase [Gemmatimonadales bacterium]|nr:GNAT family N-acetyltransferase [Gemmatimonadales bacterium]
MLTIEPAVHPSDIEVARTLFREYGAALGVDLTFQGFDEELRHLPGDYRAPRGVLLLARDGDAVTGCVAVRPIDERTAEMKRLYVRTGARKAGLGRALAEASIRFARDAGYAAIRLDTLPQMQQAQRLYQSLGFVPIPPYRYNPIPGTAYLELDLTRTPR